MNIIKRNQAQPEATEASEETTLNNVVDLGDGRLLVSVYVPNALMRTLVGRIITGIEPHPAGKGRMRPTYAMQDGKNEPQWLDKQFDFIVPKAAGVYDLSARADDPKSDEVHIENTHLLITEKEGELELRRLTYPQLIEHFGGEPLKRNDKGTLVPVQAASVTSV